MSTSDERTFASAAGVLPQLESLARLANDFFRGIASATPLTAPAASDGIAPALSSFLPLTLRPEAPAVPREARVPFEIAPRLVPDARLTGGIFDAASVRRDFPILEERVHGKPLVWLDNAATTQKPQRGHRPARRTSTSTRTPTSTAPRTRSRRAPPTPTKARARRCAASSTRRSTQEIVFVRGATEGINLVAQSWGRAQHRRRRRDRHHAGSSTTPTSCPGSCSAPRRARGCASRRSTTAARSSSTSTRSSSARARGWSRSRRSRTRSAPSRPRAR